MQTAKFQTSVPLNVYFSHYATAAIFLCIAPDSMDLQIYNPMITEYIHKYFCNGKRPWLWNIALPIASASLSYIILLYSVKSNGPQRGGP